MSSLVIFFVALIAAIDTLNKVESAPSQALDINKVLELIQQHRQNTGTSKQRRLKLRKDSSDSDSDTNSDDYYTESDENDVSDNNRYARIRKERIIDLIESVANEKNNRLPNNDRIMYPKRKPDYGQNSYVSRSEKYDNTQANNNVQAQILEKIFSQGFRDEDRKMRPRKDYTKKRLKPNRLLPLTKNEVNNYNNKNDDTIGLEDYSKVYVILNPQAVRKSKNKNDLYDLISKVLSLSSLTSNKKGREVKRKPRRYKGFIINEDYPKRRSRQSDFARRDSTHEDYKRSKRNAGNPSVGHTAMP